MPDPDSDSQEDDLFSEAVYQELRRRAQYYLRGERPGHTLQPTEIVHEAWLRLSSTHPELVLSRAQFLALAGCVMRNILVDYARRRGAVRRGGDLIRAEFSDLFLFSEDNHLQILEIDRALTRLADINPRMVKIVELRFFAGLTEMEIAEAMEISARSVTRDWKFAKTWMRGALGGSSDGMRDES